MLKSKLRSYISLSSSSYQIWKEVAEVIKEHYPIGIDRDSLEHETYPGLIKLNKSIEDGILDNENYRKRWGAIS